MRPYILLLLLIKILLSYDAPPLPPKQLRYSIRGSRVVRKPQSIKHYTITSYRVSGKSVYKCADKKFHNYGEALEYCQFLNRYEAAKRKKNSWRIRSSLMRSKNSFKRSNKFPSIKSPTGTKNNSSGKGNSIANSKKDYNKNVIGNTEKEFSMNQKMNTESFSFYIWRRVWNSCNVICYRSNRYGKYKSLILDEINYYRSNHRGDKLVSSLHLNNLAQRLANKYANEQKLDVNKDATYGMLYANVKISLARVVLKSFYDTKSKYSFYFNKPLSRTALSFTQIVWTSTQKLGVGVQQHKDHLYVVLIFYPKGNKRGEFQKNVFKRVRKTFL
uniref:SCP domain-containing protein n=1 Tax=Strongyloides papillosus TaxID=174720 RepID=A0A0N5B200_STREA